MLKIANVISFINDEDEDFNEKVEKLTNKIILSSTACRGRDKDKVKKNVKLGLLGEEAYKLYDPCYFFVEKYEYDLASIDGDRLEIKTQDYNSVWWNIGMNHLTKKHLYNNFTKAAKAGKVDTICLIYINMDSGDAYLKFEAKANTFIDFMCPSKKNNGFYYDHHKANAYGNCKIISEEKN